jgi:chemotaxis protein methyltransferase CheR
MAQARAVSTFISEGTRLPVRPSEAEARRIAELAFRLAGLHINATKRDHLAQRLTKRLNACGVNGFKAYLTLLDSPQGQKERVAFVEALTTHTTAFFREAPHYRWLETSGWAEMAENGAGREWPLRIWSAAASTGAELYSTLMSFAEFNAKGRASLRVEGFGTDVSGAILEKARRAIYSGAEVEGIDAGRRKAFLLRAKDRSDRFRIAPEIRKLASWQVANLTKLGKDGPAQADIVFLRNVLIYFDKTTQDRVVSDLCARLRPGGFLLTGHSEALQTLPEQMRARGASIYQRST